MSGDYCTHKVDFGGYSLRCDAAIGAALLCTGCRLEAAWANLAIGLALAGLAAECSYWAGISASVGVPRNDKPFTRARAGLAAAAGISASDQERK